MRAQTLMFARFDFTSIAAVLLQRIGIGRVVAEHVVVARLGVDPLQRLVEVVLVDDRDSRRSARRCTRRLSCVSRTCSCQSTGSTLSRRGPGRRPGRADRSCRSVVLARLAARVSSDSSRARSAAANSLPSCENGLRVAPVLAGRRCSVLGCCRSRVRWPLRLRARLRERIEVVAVADVDERLAAVVHLLELLSACRRRSRTRRARDSALRGGPCDAVGVSMISVGLRPLPVILLIASSSRLRS